MAVPINWVPLKGSPRFQVPFGLIWGRFGVEMTIGTIWKFL